jgi:hypothetical protein
MLVFFNIPVDFFTQQITIFAGVCFEISQEFIRDPGIGFAISYSGYQCGIET